MEIKVEDAIKWFEKINEKIKLNKEYLTSLDQVIGDSDHGINMARGFEEVVNKLSAKEYGTVSEVLKDAAMTLMSKVGGASGPLFGTAFLRFSTAVKVKESVDFETFTLGLESALEGVKHRGKSTAGEKTMIDVWSPVVDFFKRENDFQPDELLYESRTAMENTKEIMATKGRASYFKENSIGHIDPGAASSYYIFEALAEVLQEGEK
ncbi:dihydroxyacetone kinase subunit DhaL [Oceanobacillus damuensis]|uniref:dihydroxyacetone kinase subunit DhaL n=1 Tax=Oceanobacillus damuensis TaxID=937928 RepID=UPI00082F2FCE|nr:dihydroxyacetone kinase subunit DhaL [Oceanobacillus damuensis]